MARGQSPRQLPLALGHRPALSRDDLVVSPANREAVALIDSWPRFPATVVVLAGPAGSGKTHLAEIWRATAGAVSVPPLDAARAIESAARGTPVLLEDADRGALGEEALFHLVNAARGGATHLLLAARSAPAAWGIRLPDLASRLKAATTVALGAPDDALLSGVLAKLFADRQVEIDPQVVGYLVRRMERSLAAANDVVERLDRAALERKARISRTLAAEVLDMAEAGRDPLS